MLANNDDRELDRHSREWVEEPDEYEDCDDWMDYLDAHEEDERERWGSGR